MKYYVVFVTTPNRRISENLSKNLVKKKLAACVNILPGVKSRYWWNGKIVTAREELLVLKTHQARLSPLIHWVKENHPYKVCEVVAWPLSAGNKDYFKWISQSLS